MASVRIREEIESVPVRVSCPHCRTPCLVAEQHLGVPVRCGRCGRSFTTRAEAASSLRFDVGAASAPEGAGNNNGFLVRHLVSCNRDARQDQVGLIVAAEPMLRGMAAVLLPLLDRLRSESNKDAAAIEQSLAAALREVESKAPGKWAAAVLIHDGETYLGQVGASRIYHYRTAGLVQPRFAPLTTRLRLAAGDWLVLTDSGLSPDALRAEIAAAASAAELAQRLIERSGNNATAAAVRGY
jgi:predicted Zn finger-like uncharacterized protein